MQTIKDSIKTIITSLITLSLISVAYAWTEPTTTPPTGNTNPPITTSSSPQTKTGWFTADNIETYGKTSLATVTGNVGIGIPSTQDPTSKLEVKSTVDDIFRLTRDGGTFPTIFKQGTDDALVINNSEKDTITIKAGNVGIGTTDLQAKLEVAGTIKAGSDTTTPCNSSRAGSIKYNSTFNVLELCNGTKWKTVTLAPDAPTVTISASPTSIAGGQSSTLTWSSTDAVSCLASGSWSGSKSSSGSETVTPSTTSTYTLTCTNAVGSGSNSATITVRLPAITFSASANPIAIDQSTTLTWSATDATSCTASGGWSGSKSSSGSQSVTPSSSITYTLTCTSAAGSDSKSIAISVKQWQNTTGEGNLNESCDAWLARTGQSGINDSKPGAVDQYGNISGNKCVYANTSTNDCTVAASNLGVSNLSPNSYYSHTGDCAGGAKTQTRR